MPKPKQPERDEIAKARLSPEMEKWSRDRAEGFFKATQKKGMPMTYGTGRPPEK